MILKLDVVDLIGRLIWVSFYMIAILVILTIIGMGLYFITLGLNFIVLQLNTMTLV